MASRARLILAPVEQPGGWLCRRRSGWRGAEGSRVRVLPRWPCPQCAALGRTEPLKHGRDVPDDGGSGPATPIPPDRLEAYLATFPPEGDRESPRPQPGPGPTPPFDRVAARRKERRRH
jgi:hypothetical protein